MKQIRLDEGVHAALRDYAESHGGHVKGFASIAIAEFLKAKGVAIEYPRPKTEQLHKAA